MILVTLIMGQLLVNVWMCVRACLGGAAWLSASHADALRRRYYAKGVNCCAETTRLLTAAGMVAPAGSNCADLADMFPGVFADYVCTAFPNDDNEPDCLLVALIALAVSVPVTLFLGSSFEIGARDAGCALGPYCAHAHSHPSTRNSQR